MPAGHSSPIVSGSRIVLTATEGTTVSILALDRRNGELLWKRDFEAEDGELLQHRDSSPAAPSPCTRWRRVGFLGSRRPRETGQRRQGGLAIAPRGARSL